GGLSAHAITGFSSGAGISAIVGIAQGFNGIGVFGEASLSSSGGFPVGVYGQSAAASGLGGYFDGRGYFSSNVGIRTANPASTLSVAGDIDVSGSRLHVGTSGNVGIGTSTPESTLHVYRASAGTITAHPSAVIAAENSTNCYLDLLAPDANETGVLFG